jgi:hypothetical protein
MPSEKEASAEQRPALTEAPSVPRFVADALAWMEVQRAGLERLRACQLEDVGDSSTEAKSRRAV